MTLRPGRSYCAKMAATQTDVMSPGRSLGPVRRIVGRGDGAAARPARLTSPLKMAHRLREGRSRGDTLISVVPALTLMAVRTGPMPTVRIGFQLD